MSVRPSLAALLAALVAACQTSAYRGNDYEYRCERVRGYEPGTSAFRDCVYDERLADRYRYP
jgi:hypothetical protein